MLAALAVIVVAAQSALIRTSSRFSLYGGNSVSLNRNIPLTSDQVSAFFADRANRESTGRLSFGAISLSLMNQRKYTLAMILDTDLSESNTQLEDTIVATHPRDIYLRFQRKVVDKTYTISSSAVQQSDLSTIAHFVNGEANGNTITFGDVTFSLDNRNEERFLDDLRKVSSLAPLLSEFEALRPAGGLVHLVLNSPFDLDANKQTTARALLLEAVKKASKTLADQGSWVVGIVHTDFRETVTYNPGSYSRARSATLMPSTQIITARFQHPIKPVPSPISQIKKLSNEVEKKHLLGEAKNYAPIDMPRKIIGDTNFQLAFWTFIFLLVVFGLVSYAIWTMKPFEDPLIYFTEYVLDADSSIMENNL